MAKNRRIDPKSKSEFIYMILGFLLLVIMILLGLWIGFAPFFP